MKKTEKKEYSHKLMKLFDKQEEALIKTEKKELCGFNEDGVCIVDYMRDCPNRKDCMLSGEEENET